jgi:hypothetical protein
MRHYLNIILAYYAVFLVDQLKLVDRLSKGAFTRALERKEGKECQNG